MTEEKELKQITFKDILLKEIDGRIEDIIKQKEYYEIKAIKIETLKNLKRWIEKDWINKYVKVIDEEIK